MLKKVINGGLLHPMRTGHYAIMGMVWLMITVDIIALLWVWVTQ